MFKACIGNRIRFYRTLRNLRQDDLADRVGVTRQHLGRLERGDCFPSFDLLSRFCDVLDVLPLNLLLCPDQLAGKDDGPDHSPGTGGIWTTDFRTGEEHWSSGLLGLLGNPNYSRPSLTAFLRHLPEGGASRKPLISFFDKLKKRQIPSPLVLSLTRKGGARITIHFQADIIADANNEAVLACMSILDITEWQAFRKHLLVNQNQMEGIIREKTESLELAAKKNRKELELRTTAQRLARDKAEQLQRLIEVVPAIIYTRSASGATVVNTPRLKSILGHDVEELRNHPRLWMDSVHPDDLARVEEARAAAMRGRSFVVEYRIKNNIGQWIWVHDSGTQARDAEGEIFISGLAVDIIKRKQVEVALEESEKRYRLLFEKSLDGVFLHDLSGRVLDANQAALDMFGYSLEEIRAMQSELLVHPADMQRLDDTLRVLGSDVPASRDFRCLRKDGSEFVLHVRSKLIADNLAQAVLRDVTEQRRTTDALRQSEARFRKYFQTPVAGIAIVSPTFEWIDVNDRLCEMSGYSREELLRISWKDLALPEDMPEAMERFSQIITGKIDGYAVDKRHIRKDGSIVWTNMSIQCVRREDGGVDHFIAMLIDISGYNTVDFNKSKEGYKAWETL